MDRITSLHRRRSRGGGQGDRSPLLGLGIIPPTFPDALGKTTKTCSELHNFSAKLIFFSGASPRPATGGTQPLPRPHPFTLLNIYPPLLTWLRRHCEFATRRRRVTSLFSNRPKGNCLDTCVTCCRNDSLLNIIMIINSTWVTWPAAWKLPFGSRNLASGDDRPANRPTPHRADLPSLSGRMTERKAEIFLHACIA